jgi:hypothetical protein
MAEPLARRSPRLSTVQMQTAPPTTPLLTGQQPPLSLMWLCRQFSYEALAQGGTVFV